MQKRLIFASFFLLILIVSVSFASAYMFPDAWKKITGKVTNDNASCIPDGGIDDTLGLTNCCSGVAVEGSTLCSNQADWFTTWKSCTQICGSIGVTVPKCPYGPTGTPWCPCPAGTTNNGIYGIGVCNGTASNQTNSTNLYCTDTDGGKNIYVKGITNGKACPNCWNIVNQPDTCAIGGINIGSDNSSASYGSNDSCSGSNCYVLEYWPDTSTGYCDNSFLQCPNGCLNGACIATNTINQTTYNITSPGIYNIQEGSTINLAGVYGNVTMISGNGTDSSFEVDINAGRSGYCSFTQNSTSAKCTLYSPTTSSPVLTVTILGEFIDNENTSFSKATIDVEYYTSNPINQTNVTRVGACQTDSDCSVGICVSGQCMVSGTNQIVSPITTPQSLSEGATCVGCEFNNNCYPYGYRLNGQYCSVDAKAFVSQLSSSESCQNNFECGSNVCVSGQCISQTVFQQFLKWLGRLFS